MRKLLLLFLLLFSFNSLFSLDSLVYKITITTDDGEKFDKLQFGVNVKATDDIDFDLGEKKLPELVPPSDIYSVFLVKSTRNDSTFWSYVDIRSVENGSFLKIYEFKIDNLMNSFTLSWSKIGDEVDSAFIRDPFTGNIVNVDMKDNTSYYVENFAQNKFKIYVYYKPLFTAVKEIDLIKGELILYPNPAKNYVKVRNNVADFKSYTVINSLGFGVLKGKIDNDYIDISNLSKGVYLIRFTDVYNRVFVAKLLKD